MSLEEYGIDRYKVTSLFQEGPRGPKGADGPARDGTGQFVIRERIELNTTNNFLAQDILAHIIQPGEINRFSDSLFFIHYAYSTGGGLFAGFNSWELRFQHAPSGTDVQVAVNAGTPDTGVMISEIQADPWSNTHMYWSTVPGMWTGGTKGSRVTVGIDWIALGGQFVIRCAYSGGSAGSAGGIYMMKRESI
jgi:hypothetical protein